MARKAVASDASKRRNKVTPPKLLAEARLRLREGEARETTSPGCALDATRGITYKMEWLRDCSKRTYGD